MPFRIRPEHSPDIPGIRALLCAAFPGPGEARLVEALRAGGNLTLSLVAESEGNVVGHIALSPLTVAGLPCAGLGLAPLAVLPTRQRQGIGSALMRAALDACRLAKVPFLVVLGDPGYYGRFGFTRADLHGLANEYGAGPEFMVWTLAPDTLPVPGLVRYAPEFAGLE